jgi:hypothetical protein
LPWSIANTDTDGNTYGDADGDTDCDGDTDLDSCCDCDTDFESYSFAHGDGCRDT